MARTIAGKTALITGAGKRLGRAIALALARENVNIVAHCNQSKTEAESLVGECRELGVGAWTIAADLRVQGEAAEVVDQALDAASALDIVVNNAAIFPGDRLVDFSAESLEMNLRVNAFAPAQIARAFVQRIGTGDIVNLLDARMDDYDREHVSYHLSKRALFALTRMMAVEFAPNVRVNGVAPGLVLAPGGQGTAYLESLKQTNPLHAYGAADDVSEAVVYLLKSEFTTGQVIYTDGGRHLLGGLYG